MKQLVKSQLKSNGERERLNYIYAHPCLRVFTQFLLGNGATHRKLGLVVSIGLVEIISYRQNYRTTQCGQPITEILCSDNSIFCQVDK